MIINNRVAIAMVSTFAILTIGLPSNSLANESKYKDSLSYSEYRTVKGMYQLRASDVIGATVVNADEEAIGEIDDLFFSSQKNSITAVVSVGGFLGLGDKLVTVPYQDLRISSDGDSVYLNTSKAALEKKPAFAYDEGELGGIELVQKRMSGAATKSWTTVKSTWGDLKEGVSSRWSKLTDSDIDEIDGDRERLVDRIQSRYESTRDTVEREVDEWREGLNE